MRELKQAFLSVLILFAISLGALPIAHGDETRLKAIGTQSEDRVFTTGRKTYRVSIDTVVLRDPQSNVEFKAQRYRFAEQQGSGQWEDRPDQTTIRIGQSFYIGEGDFPLKSSQRDASPEEVTMLAPFFNQVRSELRKQSLNPNIPKASSGEGIRLPGAPGGETRSDGEIRRSQEVLNRYQSVVETTIARGQEDYRAVYQRYRNGLIQRDAAIQQMAQAAERESFQLADANYNLSAAAGELAKAMIARQESVSAEHIPSFVTSLDISPGLQEHLLRRARALQATGQHIAAAQVFAELANPWSDSPLTSDMGADVDKNRILKGPLLVQNSLTPVGTSEQKYRMIITANLLQAVVKEQPSKLLLASAARSLTTAAIYLKAFELHTLAGNNAFAEPFLRNAERIVKFQTGIALGAAEAVVGTIEGAMVVLEQTGELSVDLIQNPRGIVIGFKDACVRLARVFPGAISDGLFKAAVTLVLGNPVDQGRLVGQVGGDVAAILFGPSAIRAAKVGEELAEVAVTATRVGSSLGARTSVGMKIFARLEHGLATLPSEFKIRFIREGVDVEKVAVIGRSMGNPENGLLGVRDVARQIELKSGFKVATFEWSEEAAREFKNLVKEYRERVGDPKALLPDYLVREAKAFAENKAWIQKLKREGYTIIDCGNPNGLAMDSSFYNMELVDATGDK